MKDKRCTLAALVFICIKDRLAIVTSDQLVADQQVLLFTVLAQLAHIQRKIGFASTRPAKNISICR